MHKLPIVPFDVAQDLKELGFDWECYAKYDINYPKSLAMQTHRPEKDMTWLMFAPEQALVVKWLLDIHNLYVVVEPHFKQWFWEIRQINNGDSLAIYFIIESQRHTNPNAYKTHDEAQLGGIKECIKYLKNETISNK